MSDFMLMAPSNQTFAELLSNGVKYNIPRFQRDYSWELEQWEDLWADILTLDEEQHHYMGYIVLQKKGEHNFEVIDGQQRLITLSILVLAVMKHLQNLIDKKQEAEENKQRLAVFHERFIGAKNTITLRVENKLSLNRNNNRHFREICSNLDSLNEFRLSKTNSLLNDVFNFFYDKIEFESGSQLAEFVEKVTSRMIFTKIVTQDNINAYKVFETLNARGVQLSTPDLLKNHLFSTLVANEDVSDEHLDLLDEDWSAIISQLGVNNFTDFVRYHHNMQTPYVQKRHLFKSIKQIVNKPEIASKYLQSLKKFASIYSALLNPYDEWWKNLGQEYKDAKHYLEALKLFGIKQPFQILMVAFDKFSPQEFILTLKYIYNLTIRYNIICHSSANEQEKIYNKIAIKTFKEEFKRASHIKNSPEFKDLYPDDESFKSKFAYYKMPSRSAAKKIRFLLAEMETFFGREVNYLSVTLEHVCPYNPDGDWVKDFGEGVNDIQDRIGNMVLLEKDELKRANFAEKKKAYLETDFRLAKKVAEYDSWELATLSKYQEWLASQALLVWKVDYQ